ncbi:hypothetical protein MCOR02_002456 [Pyricularia oryzae]|nr:hypothetical protein MCOR01_008258 [Pyricularia oryzae]KAH9438858.1 hypothetical protein MCOR02_002456 [Pyricularia oryzae]KAI6259415.1 hypothetical protein MCOR19_004247 [Pyricularia oryzae]KAI6297264.1 hypothetical protein MCOR29_011181 [Pyricularia oryzae]KAI6366216.1 hypothetical protein MCOR32_007476 [Pyricularia oryzae]
MAQNLDAQYNAAVERFRSEEFPMIRDSIYLDHAGTTLCPKSLLEAFARDMAGNLYGNPHSASNSSQLSTSRIEDIRLQALQLFGASPDEFDLVFVANATAGIKLVSESLRARDGGFGFLYHQASHTSLVGVREEAQSSICLSEDETEELLAGSTTSLDLVTRSPPGAVLLAYTAQSNFDGRRYPLTWADKVRRAHASGCTPICTLLDAASFVSTSPLHLGESKAAPDFTVLSFYKIFGFPDLGALIVRKQAWHLFESRKYFGGGTVDMVVNFKESWHAPKNGFLHERLEDGTLPIHNILALGSAIKIHQGLFGPMRTVSSHATFLAQEMITNLQNLHHSNGEKVCTLYSPYPKPNVDGNGWNQGPIIAFNICTSNGSWVSLGEFEKLASLRDINIRTGSLCNPGGIAIALALEPWEMKRNFSAGLRCGADNDMALGKPTGVIRASLGAMSTTSDVDRFVAFIVEFFCDDGAASRDLQTPRVQPSLASGEAELCVDSLTIYPIKSCAGYSIPHGKQWQVRPEGLAWDREWCLLHRGSGQALSQKRYPKMALIKPVVDLESGRLAVGYLGEPIPYLPERVSVPLSHDPSVFRPSTYVSAAPSRVCGDQVATKIYHDDELNEFFSKAIGVPCVLARFPPGSQHGDAQRSSKARLQKHQITTDQESDVQEVHPGSGTTTDSTWGNDKSQNILLSNESPILLINLASVDALNQEIKSRKGSSAVRIPTSAFRANVVLRRTDESRPDGAQGLPYAEERWRGLTIGNQTYTMLGACRRCQMVCVDQVTGCRGDEPFSTLSKTRRFDGKVFFGVHMAWGPGSPSNNVVAARGDVAYPTIEVGERVLVHV